MELEFSDAFMDFQKAVAIIVFILSCVFLIFAFRFLLFIKLHDYYCVISDLKEEAGKRIDEVER